MNTEDQWNRRIITLKELEYRSAESAGAISSDSSISMVMRPHWGEDKKLVTLTGVNMTKKVGFGVSNAAQ